MGNLHKILDPPSKESLKSKMEVLDSYILLEAPHKLITISPGIKSKHFSSVTKDYLISSDKTGTLCRYLIRTNNGLESLYGYFQVIRIGKETTNFRKLLRKASHEEKILIIKGLFEERFESEKKAYQFIKGFNTPNRSALFPEKFVFSISYPALTVSSLLLKNND